MEKIWNVFKTGLHGGFLSLNHHLTRMEQGSLDLNMVWDDRLSSNSMMVSRQRLFYGKSPSVEVLQIQPQSDFMTSRPPRTLQGYVPFISLTEQRLKTFIKCSKKTINNNHYCYSSYIIKSNIYIIFTIYIVRLHFMN